MGFMKSKGKHAQGAHAQQINEGSQPAEEQESAAGAQLASIPEIVPAQQPASANAAAPEESHAPTSGGPSFEAFAPVASIDGQITVDGVVLHKKRNVGKVVGITFGVIIGVLLVAYIAGALVFMNWFFPRTTIMGNDVSMKSNAEVAAMINDVADGYALDVVGNGFTYRTTASDIDLKVDADGVVSDMHSKLNAWTWPVLLFQDSHDVSDALKVKYDSQKYTTEVTNKITEFNKDAVAPTDATIAYDDKTKKFTVVAEVPGTQYDAKAVVTAMDDAVSALESNVKLTGDQLVQPKVFSTDERLVNSAEMATGLVSAKVTLTMAGKPATTIDGSNLSPFVHVDENMGVTLDEAALDQWVTDLSNSFDTVGSERTYTRPDGKVITISGGDYGWATDAYDLKDQVIAAVKTGQTLSIDIPCQQEAQVYNGPGQPDWGNRYIDVDLSEQVVRMYDDGGALIWESACISGTPDGQHDTWPGVWYITNKEAPSKLIGYLPSGQKEYETTVAYWMAFEGNGIGLHDATWQPSFGGDMYASGYGSHGCVNLPYDAAETLYGICNVGDVVIAHF